MSDQQELHFQMVAWNASSAAGSSILQAMSDISPSVRRFSEELDRSSFRHTSQRAATEHARPIEGAALSDRAQTDTVRGLPKLLRKGRNLAIAVPEAQLAKIQVMEKTPWRSLKGHQLDQNRATDLMCPGLDRIHRSLSSGSCES
mmetsp:Transcript_55046/g.120424  ORF Transcript_55046/g.120424 Transcript_55046/m.120424 type:complete len:145 (-) Transcript_55046:335-769(-)